MNDRYIITWITERGRFRTWDRYSDRAKELAKELMAMGALGVEVYRTDKEKVIFSKGQETDRN